MKAKSTFRELLNRSPKVVLLALLFLLGIGGRAYATTTTCDDANPFDYDDDYAALQSCFDNYDTVLLHSNEEEGYVGYFISHPLDITRTGLAVIGVNYYPAVIIATSNFSPLSSEQYVFGIEADDVFLSYIQLDGNRYNRTYTGTGYDCSQLNFDITASGWTIQWSGSAAAVCGSGMSINYGSSGYTLEHNAFYDNGNSAANGGPWSDGLTIWQSACDYSEVSYNDSAENTDIAMGIEGGTSCGVYNNTVENYSKYAYGGLVIGGSGTYGGDFASNSVDTYNLLGFGIAVGPTMWGDGPWAVHDAYVYDNSSTGAAITLAVDGMDGGAVYDNYYASNGGTHTGTCGSSVDYTVGNTENGASVQSGSTYRTYTNCIAY